MELLSKSFNYNGIELPSDYMVISYNSLNPMRSNVVSRTVHKGSLTPYRDSPHFYEVSHADVLKIDISLMRKDEKPLMREEREFLLGWLNRPRSYEKLVVSDWSRTDYHEDTEYFILPTGFDEFSRHSLIYGYVFHFEANAPYGFMPEEEYPIVDGSVTITNPSLVDDYYYPTIELKCKDRETVTIQNVTTNESAMFLNVLPGQELVIDNQNGDITDNLFQFDYGTDTNLLWIYLAPGENELSITGNVEGSVKCRFPRKVGV